MSDKMIEGALLDLAKRCEEATGYDRDEVVSIEVDLRALGLAYHEKPFTASLDAAMTLVPPFNELSGSSLGERASIHLWDCNGVHPAHVRASAWVLGGRRCYAATPALALCAAALRARAHPNQAD